METDTPIPQEVPETPVATTPEPEAVKPEGEEGQEQQEKQEAEAKPEKTPEQREIERLRKAVDRKTRRAAEAEMRARQYEEELQRFRVQSPSIDDINRPEASDSDSARPPKFDLDAAVEAEIQRRKVREQRQSVIDSLAKDWGQEKFDALAADLDDALGGLMVNGRPKPAADAIFASETPKALIEYLADPDNADDAEKLARMNPVEAGRYVAKLETKIQTLKEKAKPQRSNAPAPIEPVRAQGSVNRMPDPKNVHAWIKWQNERERAGQL